MLKTSKSVPEPIHTSFMIAEVPKNRHPCAAPCQIGTSSEPTRTRLGSLVMPVRTHSGRSSPSRRTYGRRTDTTSLYWPLPPLDIAAAVRPLRLGPCRPCGRGASPYSLLTSPPLVRPRRLALFAVDLAGARAAAAPRRIHR